MGSPAQLFRVAALLLSCAFFLNSFLLVVEAQSGFISLDCGLPEGDDYVDNSTGISYASDGKYVEGGQIKTFPDKVTPRIYQTLRFFPQGERNCYTLQPLQPGGKYLVRVNFFYDNYDGQESPPEFGLLIGSNPRLTVLVPLNQSIRGEVITVANGNTIWVCLVNTGKGTPLISSIQLRPLPNTAYPANASQSLILQRRTNFGADLLVRYPVDPCDRIWLGLIQGFPVINTSSPVVTIPGDQFRVPSAVLQTAVTVPNVSFALTFLAVYGEPTDTVYFVLHFAELQVIKAPNETRIMDIVGRGAELTPKFNYSAPYLVADHVSGSNLEIGPSTIYNITLLPSNTSTLPPFINALESFRVLKSFQLPTDLDDVGAVEDIKSAYKIVRNWQGDPCVPQKYVWTGLGCSYLLSKPARIVSLNLSSSGITGEIPSSIVNLTALTSLDLSNNQISAKALDLLAKLPSLASLNLSGITVQGSLQDFCSKAQNGTLASRIEGLKAVCSSSTAPSASPKSTSTNSSVSNKQNYFAPIIMALILFFIV